MVARGLPQHHVQRHALRERARQPLEQEVLRRLPRRQELRPVDEHDRLRTVAIGSRFVAVRLANPGSITLQDVLYPEWATPDHDSEGHKLYGYRTMPPDKKTAYELYRDYYNSRVAWITSVGDQPYSKLAQVNSVTCVSHMELCKQPRKSPKCFLCWSANVSERVVGQTRRCGIRRARTWARR